MKDDISPISCTPIETAFLASLLGASTLVGMADPFHGWLADEIEAAWGDARQALAERRFIEVQPDGKIVMDAGVAALIQTWASAEASLLLTFAGNEEPAVLRNYHLTKEMAVAQWPSDADAMRITPLQGAAAVYREIGQFWRLADQNAVPGVRCSLREAAFIQARALAAGRDLKVAAAVLTQARLPEATAAALAETLAAPVATGALAAMARRGAAWDVAGMGILEGMAGLWRLRAFTKDGENWVEIIPCNVAEARSELRRVLNQTLPKPLPDEEEG